MEYSNIGAALSQLKGQAAYADQGVVSVSGRQTQPSAEALLRNMEPGQIFSGQITDIRGSYITITLQNMQNVQARLAENFEFLIGQKALFQVKDNQDNQLYLKPIAADAAQNGEFLVAERAIGAAGLQMTEKTLDLVKNLLAANQPIDKQSLLSYVRQLAKFPNADIQDLISLHKYQIPVNEENLNQLSNYKQFEHSLLHEVDAMEQTLSQLAQKMAEEAPEKAEAFLKELTDVLSFGKTAELSEEALQKLPEQADEKAGQTLIKEKSGEPILKEEQAETAIAKKDTAQAAENKPAAMSKEPPNQANQTNLTGKEWKEHAGKIIKEALRENFLLKPEEVADKEKVKEFYKNVAEKGERLKELLNSYGKETAQAEKPVQNLTQNVKFMQSLNEMFTYIQLPLKLANEQAHGDLYVYTKKRSKRTAEDGVSALLHLDMEHLGAVDVLVRLKGQRVTTNFTLETEELLDFIEQHMDQLEERLEKKGYSCSFQTAVKNSEEQKSFEQCLTGEAGTSSDIKRFSFDVRA